MSASSQVRPARSASRPPGRGPGSGGPRSWGQRLVIASGATLAVVALIGAIVVGVVWWRLGSFERVSLDLANPEAAGRPLNFLVVGSDSRAGVLETDADAGAFLDDGGTTGQRTDTVLVARVDPAANSVTLLSIPRDLWLPIDESGYRDRINVAFAEGGAQQLINTIRRELNIEINHYVEVNFGGFKSLVDTVGGVPMYFDTPMFDEYSGLDVPTAGCVRLDGQQALAFARSRHLQYLDAETGEWEQDFTADLGRIGRQQLFLRRAMDQIGGLGLTNVVKLNRLVGVATANVTFDDGMSNAELLGLAKRFSAASSESLRTFSLPTELSETPEGASVVLLKEAEAQPVLDVFRGIEPTATTVPAAAAPAPGSVAVDVLNGTGVIGQAAQAGDALAAIGFVVRQVGNAPQAGQVRTTVRYGQGARPAAAVVAAFLQPGVELVADGTIPAGRVALLTGADFVGITVPETPTSAAPEAHDPLEAAKATVGVAPAGAPPPGASCP